MTSVLLVKTSHHGVQVQDAGRYGCRHLGVTQGGAVDWFSMRLANCLLGNEQDAAVIEVAQGGFSAEFMASCTIAIAGADLDARIDDKPVKACRTLDVREGQTLSLTRPLAGLRAYIAMPGGIDCEPVLRSRATVLREGLGGLNGKGQAIKSGDRIGIANDLSLRRRQLSLDQQDIASLSRFSHIIPVEDSRPGENVLRLQIIPCAQIATLHGRSLFALFNDEWRVDARADRMGVRLNGPRLNCRMNSMISEGIPSGAVQLPPDGQPIVLLNDRQTIGGYPKLGTLAPAALGAIAQAATGQPLRFVPVTHASALDDCRQLFRVLDAVRNRAVQET